jgi:hypothetical protein
VRTEPAPPAQGTVLYAEDHSALRWPLTAQAIGWPILLAATLVILTGNPAFSFLPLIPLAGTGYALIALAINRPTGILITETGISIGGVGRTQRGHPGSLPAASAQRAQVFSCPWPAVREVKIVTGRADIRDLARARRDGGMLALGAMWAPFTTAALIVQVDLSRAEVPEFRPPDTRRSWFKPSRPDPYTISSTWFAPTRRPAVLQHSLNASSIPRTS